MLKPVRRTRSRLSADDVHKLRHSYAREAADDDRDCGVEEDRHVGIVARLQSEIEIRPNGQPQPDQLISARPNAP
jgi:hypothetical protein